MLSRFLQWMRRLLTSPLVCCGGNGGRLSCQRIIAAMVVFVTLARPIGAEPPSGELPRVDQCRAVCVCEPGTELLQAPDGTVWLDREVRPRHDECRLRYAKREMPFPLRRLRAHTQTDRFLPAYVDLQGVDARGRPWFLGRALGGENKIGRIVLSWIDSGILRRRQLEGGYNRQPAGRTFEARWPWAGSDVLCDADGTVWVVGATRLYKLAAGKTPDDEPDHIPFPVPNDRKQAEDLLGARNPYWGHQVYRFGGSVWVVRGFRGNCHTPGTFVVRFVGRRSRIVAWLPRQHVGGLVHHAGDVYILAREIDAPQKPTAILRARLAEPAPQPVEGVRRRIAELDDDAWARREAASKWLAKLPFSQLDLLREALAKSTSAEQQHRLGLAMRTISSRRDEVAPATLEGASAARLVLVDRDGRQHVRPWEGDHPQAEVLVFDGKTCAKIALPSPDFSLDCQGGDGRLYGHDRQALYAREAKEAAWRPVASLGELAGHDVRVLATGDTVRELTGKMVTSIDPSVWPLAKDTAIVATMSGNDGIEGVLFYDQGQAHEARSLAELLEDHHRRLGEVMEDGAAFTAGDHYEQVYFIRMGDALYVHEAVYKRIGGGCGMFSSCGIFRDAQWIERRDQGGFGPNRNYQPIVTRLAGLDLRTHRLLGFVDGCKTLKWIPMAPDATGGEEVIHKDSVAWAWYWMNNTSLPRFTGAWTLTPEVAEHLREVRPQRVEEARKHGESVPEAFPEYRSADMPSSQRWEDGKWRRIDQSLYGVAVWEDGAGGVWQFRVREAEVTFSDGRRQLIPLDAGIPGQFRLAVESPGAVWVASQQSLRRFRLERDAPGRPTRWLADRTFRLPRFGVGFAGPWIAGESLYYVSGGVLYISSRRDLVAATPGGK